MDKQSFGTSESQTMNEKVQGYGKRSFWIVWLAILFASAVVLAGEETNDAVIVQAAQPTEAEAFAAQELADFLQRSTGAAPRIVKEADFSGGPAIYVGQTEFAARQAIDFARLEAEEWVVRSAKAV